MPNPAARLVLIALVAAGCADEPRDPCSHEVCPIDELACIEQISATVACQLGEPEVVVPPVRMLTVAELTATIEAESEALTPAQQQDITDYYRGEALVGLMPASWEYQPPELEFVEQIAGYYAIEDDEIVVVTDNFDSRDAELAYVVMVHEMVHAYQDDRRDLGALLDAHASSFDRFLAVRALVEGEAELYESLAEIELAGFTPETVNWVAYFNDYRAYVLDVASETEVPSLDATLLFPYAFGGALIYEAERDGGRDGIDALYDRPPDSVRQVMGGHAAWPDELQNRDDLLDPHAAPLLPDRYELLGGGHQSAWLLNAMLLRTVGYETSMGKRVWVDTILDHVSADYLTVLRDADSEELVAIWRIQTDDPETLAAHLGGLGTDWLDNDTAGSSRHVFMRVGDDIVLVATTGVDAKPVIAELAGWQSLDELWAKAGAASEHVARARLRRDALVHRARAIQ